MKIFWHSIQVISALLQLLIILPSLNALPTKSAEITPRKADELADHFAKTSFDPAGAMFARMWAMNEYNRQEKKKGKQPLHHIYNEGTSQSEVNNIRTADEEKDVVPPVKEDEGSSSNASSQDAVIVGPYEGPSSSTSYFSTSENIPDDEEDRSEDDEEGAEEEGDDEEKHNGEEEEEEGEGSGSSSFGEESVNSPERRSSEIQIVPRPPSLTDEGDQQIVSFGSSWRDHLNSDDDPLKIKGNHDISINHHPKPYYDPIPYIFGMKVNCLNCGSGSVNQNQLNIEVILPFPVIPTGGHKEASSEEEDDEDYPAGELDETIHGRHGRRKYRRSTRLGSEDSAYNFSFHPHPQKSRKNNAAHVMENKKPRLAKAIIELFDYKLCKNGQVDVGDYGENPYRISCINGVEVPFTRFYDSSFRFWLLNAFTENIKGLRPHGYGILQYQNSGNLYSFDLMFDYHEAI